MAHAEPVLPDIRAEAERLTAEALAQEVPVRLMGGLAIWLRSPAVRRQPYAREYHDLDFAASARGRQAAKAFFEQQGYVPEKLFNAIHGAQRLNYGAPDGRWTVDVILDELAMSHKLDLRGRFGSPEPTLPLADLLLTKLQIWEINRKDLGDALCLLADHPLAAGASAQDVEAIDLGRLMSVLGADWGFAHTVERNLRRVRELWHSEPVAGTPFDVASQVDGMLVAMAAAPKTLGWKARARIGERVRWYETPEEIRHEATSGIGD